MDAVVFGQVKQLEKRIEKMEQMLAEANRILTLKTTTADLAAGQQIALDLPIGTDLNKLILKYIYVEGAASSKIDVEVLSSTAGDPFLVYKNTTNGHILYDVLDLPYEDEESTGVLHLKITNLGSAASSFAIRISGLVSN